MAFGKVEAPNFKLERTQNGLLVNLTADATGGIPTSALEPLGRIRSRGTMRISMTVINEAGVEQLAMLTGNDFIASPLGRLPTTASEAYETTRQMLGGVPIAAQISVGRMRQPAR
ncbi:MAG TPA: hypothetical protein VFQ63_02320 [Patescibacteria group bacterium]|nr:hypothetical protein [Patescibacteria group bacterium]